MEGSSSSQSLGLQYHVRSVSLPSRSHPNATKIESQLNKLKTFSCAASPDTIQDSLVGLAELYNYVEEFINSPHTQLALLQQQSRVFLEDVLEGSIGLLDSCGTLKDLLLSLKENVQDLQSALRRKGGDSSIHRHIDAYFFSRKKGEKIIAKCLRGLKKMENMAGSSHLLEIDQNLSLVIRVLRDVAVVTISIFRSILLFLSPCLKMSRWSLISKLMSKTSTAVSERDQITINELENVDLCLHTLHRLIQGNETKVDIEATQKKLRSLDARVQGFEAGLDCIFRRLIQNRASLLNVVIS